MAMVVMDGSSYVLTTQVHVGLGLRVGGMWHSICKHRKSPCYSQDDTTERLAFY